MIVLRYLLICVGLVLMFTGCNNLVSLAVGDETVAVVAGEEIWAWGWNLLFFAGGLALAVLPEARRFHRQRHDADRP